MTSQEIKQLASYEGFNLTGIVDAQIYSREAPEEYQLTPFLPQAKSVILLASGGRAYWESISKEEKQNPNPIDHSSIRRAKILRDILHKEGFQTKIIFPFRSSGTRIQFIRLAELAGIGTANTVLNLLIHPIYGPWVSLRAAIVTQKELRFDTPLNEFLPCAPCAKPCIAACPASAIRQTGFEARSCGHHLAKSQSCDEGCLSRRACIYGTAHAYSSEEAAHRQKLAKESLVRYVSA